MQGIIIQAIEHAQEAPRQKIWSCKKLLPLLYLMVKGRSQCYSEEKAKPTQEELTCGGPG